MILVTGASGHLGHLVIDALLRRVPSTSIVAGVRTPAKAQDLAAKGVQVRRLDYDDSSTIAAALAGVAKVLLISSNEFGKRAEQHAAVIDAAKRAGVAQLAYTSILRADTSKMALAKEHLATEQYLRASGIPYTILRNGWYIENYTGNLAATVGAGVLLGAAGDGRVAPAARADYADAAAVVLAGPGHEGKVYELAGDRALSLSEFAAEIAHASGKPVVYQNLPQAEYAKTLAGFGLPGALADALADSDVGIERGELDDRSKTLHALIGRATTPVGTVLAAALG